jgi:hypothetical protein
MIILAQGDTIKEYITDIILVIASQSLKKGRLSGTGTSYNGYEFVALYIAVDIIENNFSTVIDLLVQLIDGKLYAGGRSLAK